MPNQDKQKFHEIQEKHQGEYIGTDRNQPKGKNSTVNGQGNTNQSPGTTGRNR
ncbi:hypothetical protein [Bacillus sp. B-jedd]|uniref:hypothetical protein n=1 Tax=Bacillus sp. B-jedd TaxID=1476857 RepID=UPI0005156353|nr:hypothetical protein [Bacillus sp. B-jedd]CEG28375.1 hypothetical protein BN1002_03291 [Bacillus sp. B-jedd]